MLRKIAERLSRSVVLKRRLSRAFGRRVIYVSPDAALKCFRFNLESGDSALFHAASTYVSKGDIVWDVGANVGMFTLAAAHTVGGSGSVVAIEADPFLASLLQRSVQDRSNKDVSVSVLCCAVSNEIGIAKFLIAERGRAANALEKSGHRGHAVETRYVQYVPTVTLDQLLGTFGAPDFVKIDVEGAEGFVLDGAEVILRDRRPSFYIEVGSEQSGEVTEIFRRYGYRLFDSDSKVKFEVESCAFNTLAIPMEKVK